MIRCHEMSAMAKRALASLCREQRWTFWWGRFDFQIKKPNLTCGACTLPGLSIVELGSRC